MQIISIGDVITAGRCLRHDIMPQAIKEPSDIERIRRLTDSYRAVCRTRPFANRIQLALNLGARVFDLNAADLIGPQRRFAVVRQQLMTFSFVVGVGGHGYQPIGRVFHRHHATVMHAVLKYEGAMKELVL